MMKRILVVDDEDDMLWMLQRNLNKNMENVEILAAHSGEEALDILGENEIDLVLTDINMPGISGLDLLIEIKNLYPKTGVMIMTAYPSSGYKDMAMMNGSLRFIEKPFDIHDLREQVKDVLSRDDYFRGVVDGVELIDIVQFNGLSKSTSALKVTTGEAEGMIFFKDGAVIHAMYDQKTGEEAFYKILAFQGGTIENMRGVEPPLISIRKNIEALLLEGAARTDHNNTDTNRGEKMADLAPIHGELTQTSESGPVNIQTIEEKQITSEDEEMNEIQTILSEFTTIEGVHTACLVGRDGFILDHIARQGIDAEMIGAIASSGFGSADSMGSQLGQGYLTMTMIEYENGPVMFAPVGTEAFLVIVADKETNLGWIRLSIKKNSKTIAQSVSL